MEEAGREESVGVRADLMGLPEGCLTQIISLTSPKDASRLLAVSPNPALKSSADSDFVWGSFLPSHYPTIISRSLLPLPSFSSKKQLYLHLSNCPILLDKGTVSFALDKFTGKICYMIGVRELSIAWGDAPHYWSWTCEPKSRFIEVAELQNVCWLDIGGKIETWVLSPKTNYAAYFVYMIGDHSKGLQYPPVKVSVSFVDDVVESEGEVGASNAYLQQRVSEFSSEQRDGQLPRKREDGWMEIEMGEFFCGNGDDGLLEMKLKEVKVLNWKSGIVVQGIEIRPKEGIV